MSRIIREAFAERIRRATALRQVLTDLGRVSGLRIRFFGAEGAEFPPPCHEHSPLCRLLNERAAGARLCESTCASQLEAARTGVVDTTCVVGTHLLVVPVRASVGLLGFLVAAGFHGSPPTLVEVNRHRHLLERQGFVISPSEIARLCGRTPVVEPERRQSLRRLLEMAAGYLVKALSLELFESGRDLPPTIQRACRIIHERFRDDPPQEEIARAVGLSAGHFSRVFHARTGLRYKEYVNEVRLRAVRQRLRETDDPITEIAFEAGYHTLSQFNRQFKSHYGVAPRDYRRRYRSGVS